MLESGETSIAPQDQAPLTKRSRKILNCEPCRNSKLKCDRCGPAAGSISRALTDCLSTATGRAPPVYFEASPPHPLAVFPD